MKLFAVVIITLSTISITCCGDISKEESKLDYGPLIGIDLGTTYSW